jgi:Cytochrome P450
MTLSLTTLVCGLVLLTTLWIKARSKNIPPGPPRLPFIGNLHQFPSGSVISTFDKWHKKYGPIVGLSLGSQALILLGNMEVTKELFGKRGRAW